MVFAVTKGDEVAEVLEGGMVRRLFSQRFFDASSGTRGHYLDVEGKTEDMLLLVSVSEDERRIVSVRRL
ncbi:hypothetical protein EJB05_47789, partial [Eragrostis curvula]